MVETAQLPAILRLVDDESPAVRKAIFVALDSFGERLGDELAALPEPPPAEVVEQLLADVAAFRADGRVPALASDAEPGEGSAPSTDAEPDDDASDGEHAEGAFEVGQLVRHRRYGYRGVVVSVDPRCKADDEWYRGNRTQPPRDQPWYHVLVSGTESATYAAQSNLLADDSDEAIEHPLVEHFFDGRDGARYTRNTQPWPGWDPRV